MSQTIRVVTRLEDNRCVVTTINIDDTGVYPISIIQPVTPLPLGVSADQMPLVGHTKTIVVPSQGG